MTGLRALARHDRLDSELTDINALLGEVAELIQLDARTHQVRCNLELAAHLPQISVDRAQIQHANSVKNGHHSPRLPLLWIR